MELELSPITLLNGENTIYVELLEPNGLPDVNPSDNTTPPTAPLMMPVKKFQSDKISNTNLMMNGQLLIHSAA